MGFAEWIKSRLDDLRAMVSDEDDTADAVAAAAAMQTVRTPDNLELRFNSSPANVAAVRKSIEQFSETAGLDAPAREEVGLVVNEALANVIRHAYAGATDKPVQVKVERIGPPDRGVKISIRDWGNGVDPTRLDVPDHDPLVPGGLGLLCLRRLMDGLNYRPQSDGMLLEMSRTTSGSMAAAISDADKAQ
jgi:serine/threonine-protein kinase RsbW